MTREPILFLDEFKEEGQGVAEAALAAMLWAGEAIISAEFPAPIEFPTSTDFEDSKILAWLFDPIDEESDCKRAAAHCAKLATMGPTVKASIKDRHIAEYAADWSLPYWMVYSAVRN